MRGPRARGSRPGQAMSPMLFSPQRIGPLEIPNRVVVSPMCQYSATDGRANEWHRVHMSTMALSGAGLVALEATAPDRRGRITHNCLGLWDDACEAALADVLATVRAVSDTPLALQISHAGRKASTQRPWEGRGPLQPHEGPWKTLSPSGLPLGPDGPATRAMTEADMADVIESHRAATERAVRLGVEMLELHAAHGYLLSTFLSPLSNTREDAWGGAPEARMRFPLEVVRAVRAALPQDRALGVKVNGTDWAEGGFAPDDAVAFARALAEEGVDMVTLSGGGVVLAPPPKAEPGYQLEAARRIKTAGLPITVGAVGLFHDPAFAEAVVAAGDCDTVALGRAMLFDPRWAFRAAAELGVDLPFPPQYTRAAPGAWPPAAALQTPRAAE